MSDTVISINGLGKRYQIGGNHARNTLRDTLAHLFKSSFRRRGTNRSAQGENTKRTIWALKDVTAQVQRGEVVGLIGPNGAGKSTILKIISMITEPTEGTVRVRGRVGSLLEVGTGFHSELTGRENIYLSGAILGMKRAEIERKFDEIVAFAGTEQFIDTPVKHYSSGMYLRLAFAVAAHLEPEILLVDEVLAVGDAAFQRKCLGKMDTVAQSGRTVLFVSHNLVAVQSLCDRVLWLNQGRIVEEGAPHEVVSHYIQSAHSDLTEQTWSEMATAPGNDKVRLHRAAVRPVNGCPGDVMTVRTPLVMEFEYWNLQPGAHLNLSLHVYNEQGILIFNAGPLEGRPYPAGLIRDVCQVPGNLLNDGMHRAELLVVQDGEHVLYKHSDLLIFDIQDAHEMRGAWFGKWQGAVRPDLPWSSEPVTERRGVETDGFRSVRAR